MQCNNDSQIRNRLFLFCSSAISFGNEKKVDINSHLRFQKTTRCKMDYNSNNIGFCIYVKKTIAASISIFPQ